MKFLHQLSLLSFCKFAGDEEKAKDDMCNCGAILWWFYSVFEKKDSFMKSFGVVTAGKKIMFCTLLFFIEIKCPIENNFSKVFDRSNGLYGKQFVSS